MGLTLFEIMFGMTTSRVRNSPYHMELDLFEMFDHVWNGSPNLPLVAGTSHCRNRGPAPLGGLKCRPMVPQAGLV